MNYSGFNKYFEDIIVDEQISTNYYFILISYLNQAPLKMVSGNSQMRYNMILDRIKNL